MCEEGLNAKLSTALRRIHFHGLDVEMENLTVDSNPQLLDIALHKNLHIERSRNGPSSAW